MPARQTSIAEPHTKTNNMIRISSALAALIVGASFAFAEDAPIPPQDDAFQRDVAIARSVTESTRQATVAANLPLSASQGKAFWPVYLEYRADVAKQNVRLAKLIELYSLEYSTLTEDEAKQLTRTYLDIDRERLELKERYLKKFEKVLPAALVARAMQTEQKLDAMQQFTLARAIPLVPAPVK